MPTPSAIGDSDCIHGRPLLWAAFSIDRDLLPLIVKDTKGTIQLSAYIFIKKHMCFPEDAGFYEGTFLGTVFVRSSK